MPYPRKFLYWHLLAWLAFFTYQVLGRYLLSSLTYKKLWLIGSFTLACIPLFYSCYLLVFPRLARAGRLALLVPALLVVTLAFTGFRSLLEEGLYPLLLGFQNYQVGVALSTYLFDGFYYAIPTVALAGALWAVETSLRRQRENQQLTAEKRVAEAAFLKTQINPHFLHNTLNMLYGMAYGKDKLLADSLLKLSELMRYMLRDTPDGLVSLSEELEYLENFLALHHLRYPGCLCAELRVQGDPTGCRVAPLLLIPFIENAFKHGVLDDPATPVRMQLVLTPATVEFTVENQRHDYLAALGSGIGLANLRRRLALLYPGRFTCQVGAVGSQFRAYLCLPAAFGKPAAALPTRALATAAA